MLTDLFAQIGIWLLRLVVWVLPEWEKNDTTMAVGIAYVTNVLIGMNDFFPVKTLFYCIGTIFSFELLIIIANIISGSIALVRGSGKPEIK